MSRDASAATRWPGRVRLASVEDVDTVLPLFVSYRAFYKAPPNEGQARQFLLDRLRFNQSTIFLAEGRELDSVGFAQLYPTFTSVGLAQVLVLNDLFVAEPHRGRGVGECLLQKVREHAFRSGASKLRLSTAVDNQHAQRIYERAGWERNDAFHTYELALLGEGIRGCDVPR